MPDTSPNGGRDVTLGHGKIEIEIGIAIGIEHHGLRTDARLGKT